ncbi:MAG: TrfA family protein [Neisseriaceae bacterium]|nr:TrfA family protein [Neisseriaceae bacterium]
MQGDLFQTPARVLNQRTQKMIEQAKEKTPEKFLAQHGIDMDKPLILADFVKVKNDFRVMPNDFARSSLFFVKKKGTPRQNFNRKQIAHLSDKVELYYTGQELRADDDELVWLSLVHSFLKPPIGEAVEIRVADLLKDLGWANNGENYDKIRTIISRLQATGVLIKNKLTYGDLTEIAPNGKREKIAAVNYAIRLISDYAEFEKIDGMPTKYLISLDKRLIFLFAGGLFSYLHWEDYKKLTPTGRRLTDYVLSHKEPLPLAVQSFLLMCGSDTADLPAFRQNQQAKRVCDELVKKGIVKSAEVIDGSIHIERFDRSPLPNIVENMLPEK